MRKPKEPLRLSVLGAFLRYKSEFQKVCVCCAHLSILKTSFFFLRFYLFIHERHRERKREAETQAAGEAGCGTQSDMGLDPWSPGSGPELKAALNR